MKNVGCRGRCTDKTPKDIEGNKISCFTVVLKNGNNYECVLWWTNLLKTVGTDSMPIVMVKVERVGWGIRLNL